MLVILQLILAAIGMILAIYGLITQDFQFQYYMMLALGLMFLVMGFQAFKDAKNGMAGCFWLLPYLLYLLLFKDSSFLHKNPANGLVHGICCLSYTALTLERITG